MSLKQISSLFYVCACATFVCARVCVCVSVSVQGRVGVFSVGVFVIWRPVFADLAPHSPDFSRQYFSIRPLFLFSFSLWGCFCPPPTPLLYNYTYFQDLVLIVGWKPGKTIPACPSILFIYNRQTLQKHTILDDRV